MFIFFPCRWRKSQCRPLTQRMTALCWDTFTTVSSLLHGSLQSSILTGKLRTSSKALHQPLSHHDKRASTDWRDMKFFAKTVNLEKHNLCLEPKRLSWHNEKNWHKRDGHNSLSFFSFLSNLSFKLSWKKCAQLHRPYFCVMVQKPNYGWTCRM